MTLRMLFTTELHKLEYDPRAQYRFNLWAAWAWLVQIPIVAILLICFNSLWVQISIFYVAEASVWALVATHFGAMSASLAAFKGDQKENENVN